MRTQYLYGINPVICALKARKRKLISLYIHNPEEKPQILSTAKTIGVPTHVTTHDGVEKYALNRPHQGVVLVTTELVPTQINNPSMLPGGKGQLYLVIDSSQDSFNLGGVIRTAYFLHASGIILNEKTQVTSGVAKASSGATEMMNLYNVKDLPVFLNNAKVEGWRIFGHGKGLSIDKVNEKLNTDDKVMLVISNENETIRPRVRSICEELLWVDGGNENLSGLNLNSLTSILLYAVKNAVK